MTELGRLGAFITKVKKGSLADVVGHLRAGKSSVAYKIYCILVMAYCMQPLIYTNICHVFW